MWNKLKYVEINWNVIFSKIILIVILKHKRAVPVPLYIFIILLFQYFALPLLSLAILMIQNHSHLDSKRQKSSTRTTLYFYDLYVSTKVNMNKFETNELMSNWKNELEICWNKLKYVEINWNVIFSKIILIVILKHKRAVPVPLYILSFCCFNTLLFHCFHWQFLWSKIILILILKGKRAVPVQLYIFIIYMCLQRWIWINLKLMNWCQTERMNLKYVEINWNMLK